jgi:Tfp pilus tip-associated adhesin PilY1
MRMRPPSAPRRITLGAALTVLALWPAAAAAQQGDELLFSASGGAAPNILLLLDTSGSMGKEPSDVGSCTQDCRKRDLAGKAIRDLVTTVNPPDGQGGYVNNVRFGFSIFTKDASRLLVPVGDDTTQAIVDWVTLPDIPTAADNLNSMGGNSHGLAIMDAARYFAHNPGTSPTSTFGPFPPFGWPHADYTGDVYPDTFPDVIGAASADDFPYEDPKISSMWDLACRPSFLVHIDDGLWGGNDGGRFGDCTDLDGDGQNETCALEFIGDASGDGNFWMEDITSKMFNYDFAPQFTGLQSVVTHVISFDDPKAAGLMEVVAAEGGGTFHFATSGETLTQALFDITVNIFESLGAFAGVAVPSSRTGSGASLYNAWFEPSARDPWAGHLEAYGLSTDGVILDKDGDPATDPDTGELLDPHNPYWDAGEVLKTNASRTIYTTDANGDRIVLNTSNVSIDDLALQSADPPPPPPPGPCDPVPANLPSDYMLWIFKIDGVEVAGPPYEALPDKKVKLRYCAPPSRFGIKKDWIGTFPVDGSGTDAIEIFERKDKEAICTYDVDGNVTGGWKEHDVKVGKTEQRVQIRYYLADDFTESGLAGYSDSICVTKDASGTPPPPPPNPDFQPYPNASGSGIDTYDELQVAVIDFAYGKDAFDQDGDADYTEQRTTVLGDIFHSTPLVIGQPTRFRLNEPGFAAFRADYDERDRVVYVGANDGMLHAFHAGDFHADDPATTGVNEGDDPATAYPENGYYDQGTGEELFGYVPRILLDDLKYLSRNSPRSHYYVDAPPVGADAWLGDGSGSDTTKEASEWATVVVSGLREGGPGYMALDVSDPGAVDGDAHGPYPLLLWEFTHSLLGESWSEPVITRVKVEGASSSGDHCGYDDGEGDCREQWVAIFGAGYERTADPNHFTYVDDPNSLQWSNVGKAIFMVALDTGEVLAQVQFDPTGDADGTGAMKYALPSNPAVLDVDFDGFADVVYIGDLGGQVWKWDIHEVGADADADGLLDNWSAGVFFRSDPETLDGGQLHYRSFFSPPAATFVNGQLTLAFGSGEREDLRWGGDEDASTDENNRFYVVKDPDPIGANAFVAVTSEADMSASDVTSLAADPDLSDAGFYFTLPDGEKFVTDVTIFAGLVIVASYQPAQGNDVCLTSGGQSFLHVFEVDSALGFFGDDATPAEAGDRKLGFGGGLPSNPRVSLGRDPSDDRVYVKTSTGQIVVIGDDPSGDDGFARTSDTRNLIYWRQIF